MLPVSSVHTAHSRQWPPTPRGRHPERASSRSTQSGPRNYCRLGAGRHDHAARHPNDACRHRCIDVGNLCVKFASFDKPLLVASDLSPCNRPGHETSVVAQLPRSSTAQDQSAPPPTVAWRSSVRRTSRKTPSRWQPSNRQGSGRLQCGDASPPNCGGGAARFRHRPSPLALKPYRKNRLRQSSVCSLTYGSEYGDSPDTILISAPTIKTRLAAPRNKKYSLNGSPLMNRSAF